MLIQSDSVNQIEMYNINLSAESVFKDCNNIKFYNSIISSYSEFENCNIDCISSTIDFNNQNFKAINCNIFFDQYCNIMNSGAVSTFLKNCYNCQMTFKGPIKTGTSAEDNYNKLCEQIEKFENYRK